MTDQTQQEVAAELGRLIDTGDDAAAVSVEDRAAQDRRNLIEKHEKPAEGFVKNIRDETEAGFDLADIAAGRATTRKPVGDDDVAAYLAKYGGDTDKALRAAVEAQRLIGEHGNTIGELRQQLAGQDAGQGEYDDVLDQDDQPDVFTRPDVSGYSNYEELEDAVYEMMEDDPAQAVMLAQQSGNPGLVDEALDAWHEQDPRAASRYERQAEYALMEQRRQAVDHHNAVSQAQLAEAYENAASSLRDFDRYEQRMAEIAASPEGLALMAGLNANTVGAKERVIRGLYALARGDASNSEEALAVTVPHVATTTSVPAGSVRARNRMLDGMAAEADAMNRVNEMWAQGTRQAGKRP